nr:fibrinogen alpha chain [Paramormyrops kingsleyae]
MWLLSFIVALSVLLFPVQPEPTVGPRGNRPVEHAYKSEACTTEKNWPFCTDEDWGPKCPSGCRINGILDQTDRELLSKIDKIRRFLEENRRNYKTTDQVSKQTYDYIREKLLTDAGHDNRFKSLAEQLRERILTLKVRIDQQLKILEALKTRVREQVKESERTEVDIDIKLRSCKGSCAGYAEYRVDKESYVTLEKHLSSLEAMKLQNVETVSTLKLMKSRVMKDVIVPSHFKAGAADGGEQKQDYFSDVGQVKFTLELPTSSQSAAASVSKTSGTAQQTASGAASGSTSHITTQTVQCTRTIRKQVTHTKDGPVEKVEVIGGGPGCEGLDDSTLINMAKTGKEITGDGYTVKLSSTGGDVTSMFSEMGKPSKSITQMGRGDDEFFSEFDSMLSSANSKSTTGGSSKTVFKSSTKTIMGDDLGAFQHMDMEDDLPDIHARSFKGSQDRKKRDYIGKDCLDILQKHAAGHKSGLFKIKPEGSDDVVQVYCDQDTVLGGWVLVQQRMDGSINFNRTWDNYKEGFGSVDEQGHGEVWLGNKYLHSLTQGESMLRVELEDWDGRDSYAEYSISLGSESEGYPLSVSAYVGDAGDALVKGSANLGAFLSHADMKFSTYDRDQDKWEENCAEMYGGGWWYNNCQSANLNGIYYRGGQYDLGSNTPYEIENGVVWLTFRPADYSLKTVRMKIRPVDVM